MHKNITILNFPLGPFALEFLIFGQSQFNSSAAFALLYIRVAHRCRCRRGWFQFPSCDFRPQFKGNSNFHTIFRLRHFLLYIRLLCCCQSHFIAILHQQLVPQCRILAFLLHCVALG